MKRRVKNEYYENIKYTLYVLRLTSVFPFGFQKSDVIWIQVLSTILSCVSATSYYLTVQSSILYFHTFFSVTIYKLDFKEVVGLLSNLYIRFYFLAMPILTWKKGKSLRAYIDHWRQFQIDFQSVSAQFLVNKSTRRQIRIAFLISFTISSIIYGSHIYLNLSTADLTFYILMSTVVYTHYFLVLYWYVNGAIIVSTMETFLIELEHSFKIGDHRKLMKFLHVWLKLRDLNDEFQESNSSLFLGHLGLVVINGVTQIYFVLNFLSAESVGRTGLVIAALIVSDAIFIHIYMDVAEKILLKMTSEIQHILLSKNIMYVDPQLIKEAWHFMDIIWTNPPKSDLNGYFSMARSVSLSIVAAALNFVIIIRQFNMYQISQF